MGNSFDNRAATWDENPRRIKLVEQVSILVSNEIDFSKIETAIDYGCGTGLLGYKFIEKVNEMLFCDTSAGMLEQVKLKQQYYGHKNVTILNADFTAGKLPNKKSDLILSMLVLHHVPNIESLVGNFAELLNNNGYFCWIDLDQEDGSFHGFDHSIPHNGFSRNEIEEALANKFKITFYTNELSISKEVDGELKQYRLFVMIGNKI